MSKQPSDIAERAERVVPTQRDSAEQPTKHHRWAPVPQASEVDATATARPVCPLTNTLTHHGLAIPLRRVRKLRVHHRDLLFDAVAIVTAGLDVALIVPPDVQPYSLILSIFSCVVLVLRRRFPFMVALATIPGFLAGWAQLASMIALGTLAWRKSWSWQTIVAATGVWLCRFFTWPLTYYNTEKWTEHLHDAVYGCMVAGMPIAIGMLITARRDLSDRIAQLAASRDREQVLEAAAARADERAKIARDMHDVVSHQVGLIALQAGALQATSTNPVSTRIAATIRELSRRTLDELRDLVGTWRNSTSGEDEQDLAALRRLVEESAVQVELKVDLRGVTLPAPVAAAAYRTVQEALTNVRKYATTAAAAVRVAVRDGELLVEVRNEAPTGPPPEINGTLPSGGHGLTGLRERADLLGGHFEAARTEPGGFLVRASFPLTIAPSA